MPVNWADALEEFLLKTEIEMRGWELQVLRILIMRYVFVHSEPPLPDLNI